jgi:hypothetical protein
MLADDQAPTCSLVHFLEAWKEDPNLVWHVRTRHLIHLLEVAAARIEALETLLSEIEGAQVGTDVGTNAANPLGTASSGGTQPADEPKPDRRHEKPRYRGGWIPGRRQEGQT